MPQPRGPFEGTGRFPAVIVAGAWILQGEPPHVETFDFRPVTFCRLRL